MKKRNGYVALFAGKNKEQD